MPIAHLTLATRDVDRTRRFFAEAFGLRVLERPSNIPCRAAWLEIAPGQELHLVEVEDFAPSPFEREFGRHVAIAVSTSEFSALKQRLRKLGAELVDPLRATAFERFFFREPNGYVFEVVPLDGRESRYDLSPEG